VYYVAVTLDGFIAARDGTTDFFPLSEGYLRQIRAEFPETFPGHLRAALGINAPNAHFDTVVMGRGTYDPALSVGITSPFPHLRQ
jgi:dihydrofolate reductase